MHVWLVSRVHGLGCMQVARQSRKGVRYIFRPSEESGVLAARAMLCPSGGSCAPRDVRAARPARGQDRAGSKGKGRGPIQSVLRDSLDSSLLPERTADTKG